MSTTLTEAMRERLASHRLVAEVGHDGCYWTCSEGDWWSRGNRTEHLAHLADVATQAMSDWLGEQQGAIEAALRERGPWMPPALAASVLAALRSRIKPTPPISEADWHQEWLASRNDR